MKDTMWMKVDSLVVVYFGCELHQFRFIASSQSQPAPDPNVLLLHSSSSSRLFLSQMYSSETKVSGFCHTVAIGRISVVSLHWLARKPNDKPRPKKGPPRPLNTWFSFHKIHEKSCTSRTPNSNETSTKLSTVTKRDLKFKFQLWNAAKIGKAQNLSTP